MHRVLVVVALAACGNRHREPAPPAPPPPAPPPPAPVATDCVGSDRRLYGTTCCDVERIEQDRKYPGQIYLHCRGPQIGRACHAKADCDVACSCDPPDRPLSPGAGPQGPADGTTGVTGACVGQLAIGVWMCRLDEDGKVSHMIVD